MGALAAARGITLRDQSPVPARSILAGSEDEAVAIVRELGATFARTAPGHRMSSLQDVERGRALEVEETAGYGLRLGRELGLTMPTLELCYRLAISVHRAHLAAG
jgi:2-dehydropantoate 2-reductase